MPHGLDGSEAPKKPAMILSTTPCPLPDVHPKTTHLNIFFPKQCVPDHTGRPGPKEK